MDVAVPSLSGARSAEQSTILQFTQTQDRSVEHSPEAGPHQVEGIPLQGIWECPGPRTRRSAGASAAPACEGNQLQECVTGGCCWLAAAQSSAGQLLLWQLLPQALDWQAQRCWGLISHPAALFCQLSFVPACGAQFISMCGSSFTDAESGRFATFVRWGLPFQS